MIKPYLFLALSALGVASLPAANAGDFYAGAGIGLNYSDLSGGDFDKAFAAQGFSSSTSVDDGDTGLRLFAGYQLNQYLGLELGWQDLGEVTSKSRISSPLTGSVKTTQELDGFTARVKLGANVSDQVSVFAKLGVMAWDADVSAKSQFDGISDSESEGDDGTDFTYGIGAAFRVNDQFSVRGDWDRVDVGGGIDADYDTVSISAMVHF